MNSVYSVQTIIIAVPPFLGLRYGYAVQDGETGNDFNQQEQSNGDEVIIDDTI